MSRCTGPVYRVSRRFGYSILETGKELERRPFPPGQHGQKKGKLSNYALQLIEKQKVRFNYGLSEKQMKNTFATAKKQKGNLGENFLVLLETRLDNLVYKAGFASTKRQARQLVGHKHVLVDGKKLNIPSYQVQVSQIIAISEKASAFEVVKDNIQGVIARPNYIEYDKDSNKATLTRMPNREEFLIDIKESLIIEFYNR